VGDRATVSEPAPAKLNLFLRVRTRRPDGFHDVDSVVQPVTLADGIQVRRADNLTVAVAGEWAAGVPVNEENLAVRAARGLADVCGSSGGASIAIVKRIPVAGGLGGGSSDAAATLRALNDLWGCGLELQDLADVGASVGSDVPALVHGRPVMIRGRGEVVGPVDAGRTWWVLVPFTFGIAASEAYGWWDEDGGLTGPDPAPLLEALKTGDPISAGGLLFNDLEEPVSARRPVVREVRDRLLEAEALGAFMCGSGPTVAALARDGFHAAELADRIGGWAVSSMSGPRG
jgi:4-diphosphocytidyl-2-C-methyl-D-erythritol kinase